MPGPDREATEADKAAAEAAAIGGRTSSEPAPAGEQPDEAQRPLDEAGQGQAEGFEQAEGELIDHASHGDQRPAHRAIEDSPPLSEAEGEAGAEADHERSSERSEDLP